MHELYRWASFFFFNDTATTEIYTLSLHDALPILRPVLLRPFVLGPQRCDETGRGDRKSTRLNSSHGSISYAVFCWKKKNEHCSWGLPRSGSESGGRRIRRKWQR